MHSDEIHEERFQVIMPVTIETSALTPCTLVEYSQHFRGTSFPYLYDRKVGTIMNKSVTSENSVKYLSLERVVFCGQSN